MKPKLICLVRRHQWHNGWDEEHHQTVWTCKRCGTIKGSSGGTAVKGWWLSGGGTGVGGM